MKFGLSTYISDFKKELNYDLMNKVNDAPLVDYIMDSWRSLEVVPNIKITDFKYSDRESSIDINDHIFKREKKKKKKDRFQYKFINDDRCGKLTVSLIISVKETDPETGEPFMHEYPLTKSMLIPIKDENGNYYIKGKKYYMIYQLVEKSTYTSNSSITLKSLMPIAVKRNVIHASSDLISDDDELRKSSVKASDLNGEIYNLPSYSVFVFRKEIPIILFYMAKGLSFTLSYLNVDNVISVVPYPDHDSDYLYFKISSECYIKVIKDLFLKYPFVQSVVGGLLEVTNKRTTIPMLESGNVWVKKLSPTDNFEKGKDILKFFNRLLDETTKKILKVDEYHKEDIYSLLRWMMQEFNELRLKDNMDLANKRLRCNECIASLLTKEFSRRLNTIFSLGDKATIDNFKNIFKFPGDILIQKMHTSGILRFDESVNDMTFFSKFKYTNKGPHALGSKNSNNIGIKYRGIHPSFLGNIDILVCGNSDPGTSGLLTPFGKIKGLCFDDSDEPEDFYFKLNQDLSKFNEDHKINYIKIDCDNPTDYYKIIDKLHKINKEDISVYGTSRDGELSIIVEPEDIGDGETQSNTEKS